jgi:hypothetical protein
MAGTTEPTRGTERRAGRRRRAALGSAVVLGLVLTGCSGDGGITLPTELPTGLPTTLPSLPSPTITLPTLPSPPTDGPAETTTPETTAPETTAPEETSAPEETAPEETAPAETAPAETPEAAETPTAAPPVDDDDAAEDDGGWGWLWPVLALLLLAVIIAIVLTLLRRRRQRAEWSSAVEESLVDAVWLRDSIVPTLLAQSPQGRAGVWGIARARALGLDQALRALLAEAPDADSGRDVAALHGAVDSLRRSLDQAATMPDFGGGSTVAALQQSQLELDEAIRPLQHSDRDTP